MQQLSSENFHHQKKHTRDTQVVDMNLGDIQGVDRDQGDRQVVDKDLGDRQVATIFRAHNLLSDKIWGERQVVLI